LLSKNGNADVVRAIKFVRQQTLAISVCGGGHNFAGRSIADNAMLINMRQWRSVQVNPNTKRVAASGGATLGNIDHETGMF
jgi:FAD/FMN-containing dehydrogenase